MMGKFTLIPRNAGFTLVEILIAISILATVLSLVYGAYKATFFNSSGLEKNVITSRHARIILDRFTKDIESMLTNDISFLNGIETEIDGVRVDTISFTSTANIVFQPDMKPADVTNIKYTIHKNDQNALFSLFRHDTPDIPGNITEDDYSGLLVSKKIKMFQITYFNLKGEKSSNWMSSQDKAESQNEEQNNEQVLPSRIMIEIRLGSSSDDKNSAYFKTSVALPPIGKKTT